MTEKIILGKYQRLAKIGSGSYGNIYKCIDTSTDEVVAIKKFKKHFKSRDEAYNLREVRVLQVLDHPNLIQTKEVKFEAGRLYLVFEFAEENLTDYMKRIYQETKKKLDEA